MNREQRALKRLLTRDNVIGVVINVGGLPVTFLEYAEPTMKGTYLSAVSGAFETMTVRTENLAILLEVKA